MASLAPPARVALPPFRRSLDPAATAAVGRVVDDVRAAVENELPLPVFHQRVASDRQWLRRGFPLDQVLEGPARVVFLDTFQRDDRTGRERDNQRAYMSHVRRCV